MIATDAKIYCLAIGKGRKHDFRLFKESRVQLHYSVSLEGDSAYQGLQKLHAHCRLPYRRSKTKPLQKEQRKHNRSLSQSRVSVEHVIGKLKVFRLLAERYRNRRKRFGLRVNLIAGILNYELGI